MTIRSIIVHIGRFPGSEVRTDIAASLAKRFDAALTGIHVMSRSVAYVTMAGEFGGQWVGEVMQQERAVADAAGTAFAQRTGGAGIRTRWHVEEGIVADVLVRHARVADLTVIGQAPLSGGDLNDYEGVADEVVLGAGRPVLLVPHSGTFPEFGSRVLVAWDGGRESVRALADALPLLKDAQSVRVVTVEETADATRIRRPTLDDAVRFLHDHGIKAEGERLARGGIKASDALLAYLADRGCDLLVAGAYGHGRLRELLMGGVTRDLLDHATVPVLMSH